jgi:hypothetical protein
MPEKATRRRAKAALRQGKSPTTAAGEFVREEIEHIREGKHGARSTEQAIAIGLSKARKAGVPLPPRGTRGKRQTKRTRATGRPSRKRSRATLKALKREPKRAASKKALSRHARKANRRRQRRTR